MSKYVDSFIIPVPKSNIEEYKEIAKLSAEVWKDHGALDYFECLADDVPKGKITCFHKSVDAKEDETIVFACITYKDREHRDQVNKKAMEDKRLEYMMDPSKLPFDGKRLIWGGFEKFLQ